MLKMTYMPTCMPACVPSSHNTSSGSVSTMKAMATSVPPAHAATDHLVSKEVIVSVTPAPTIPSIYPINVSFFFMEIVYCVPLADCLLMPACPYSHISDYAMDSPMPICLHQSCYLSVWCPLLLIIALSFTTICVATLPCVLLSCYHLMPMLLPFRG